MEELSVDQAHAAFKIGKYTARTLVEYYLERIRLLDQSGPQINSILAISNTALSEADALDTHFTKMQRFVGPLHGICIVVKDQIDTKDIATTYGSQVFRNYVPTEDAVLVQKLKASGAIILAKTTLPGALYATTDFIQQTAERSYGTRFRNVVAFDFVRIGYYQESLRPDTRPRRLQQRDGQCDRR